MGGLIIALFHIFIGLTYLPLTLIGLVGAIGHRTAVWYTVAVGCFATDFLIGEYTRIVISLRSSLRGLEDFSKRLRQLICLEELSAKEVDEIIPRGIRLMIAARYFGMRFATRGRRRAAGVAEEFPLVRVFYVASGEAYDYHITYVSFFGPSYVILFEPPSALGAIEKYRLYHELSHATFRGISAAARRYATPARFGCAAVAIVCFTHISWWWPFLAVLGLQIALSAAWKKDIDAEVYADSEALAALDREDLLEVSSVFSDVWAKDQQYQDNLAARQYGARMRHWFRAMLSGIEKEERRKVMDAASSAARRMQAAGKYVGLVKCSLIPSVFAAVLGFAIARGPALSGWLCLAVFLFPIRILFSMRFFDREYTAVYASDADLERFVDGRVQKQTEQRVASSSAGVSGEVVGSQADSASPI